MVIFLGCFNPASLYEAAELMGRVVEQASVHYSSRDAGLSFQRGDGNHFELSNL